jgi:hypothetical protein
MMADVFSPRERLTRVLNRQETERPLVSVPGVLGNISMSGAAAFLLNSSFRSEISEWVQGIEAVELAGDKGFKKAFISFWGF